MTNFQTSHNYALSMKIDELLRWAGESAVKVHDLLDKRELRPIFCYTGMSGIGHATALASAYFDRYGATFGLIYVRKEHELSHGQSVEKTLNNVEGFPAILVFVDDTVASGNTQARVMRKAITFLDNSYRDLILDERFIRCTTHDTFVAPMLPEFSPTKEKPKAPAPSPWDQVAAEPWSSLAPLASDSVVTSPYNDDAFAAAVAAYKPLDTPFLNSIRDGKRLTLKGAAMAGLDLGALQRAKEREFSG